ncbi:hypothetical protein AALH74_03650 [Lactobacillus johnsonii]|uniref:hypothetical protein n=1 Tax=Lactobacillus TaxID=1578 RepID=UPI001AEC65CD|nr:hypothetical protein [Lactobacillus taiwanensis]QTQ39474.1 hypothetical protein H1A07_06325 [Lactobacillus taiwanensis]
MAYEYSRVSPEDYQECKEIANCIISDVATTYNVKKKDIKYNQVVNYLYHNFPPFNIICFSKLPTALGVNYPDINRFNNLLSGVGLDVTCSHYLQEKPSFVDTVDGITTFVSNKPIVFLNAASNQYYAHVIFTIIHELIHVYESFQNSHYMEAAALIGNSKLVGAEYPEELQPLENKTNVIASLLYTPSISLKEKIMTNSFMGLCTHYFTSQAAMHNRLFNYFFYECKWNEYAAKNAVFAFRNCDLNGMQEVREKIVEQNISGSIYSSF